MTTKQTKSLTNVQIKDAAKGEVTAVFSTLDVLDHDKDVVRKGSFEDGAAVVISAYGHQSWKGKLPVGKGWIREDGDEVILDAKFFLGTSHGHDTFETVKELAEDGLGEWSYSLESVEATKGDWDGERARIITKLSVREVSPVLRGSSIGTHTVDAKAAAQKMLNSLVVNGLHDAGKQRFGSGTTWVYPHDFDVDAGYVIYSIYSDDEADRYVQVDFTITDDEVTLETSEVEVERVTTFAPKGAQFSEHAKSVLAGVDGLIERAGEVVALRATKGKPIAEGSKDLLAQLDAQIESLKALIGDETSNPPPDTEHDVQAEYLRFLSTTQGVLA